MQAQLTLQTVATGLERPVGITHAGDSRLFVTLQCGRIVIVDAAGVREFLDMRSLVRCGGEEGLLSVAFHPRYAENRTFFVDYTATAPRRTVIAKYQVDLANPNRADPASETVLLEVGQPYSNHNGGQIAFGPDGYLYVALGDGGSGGDPQGHGQNPTTLLGTILRIDVDLPHAARPYGIPADNPFVDDALGRREEIWAYGLRNPWRFSFDRETGELWAGDVGQRSYEEIDLIRKGGNYGWNVMEGFHCFRSGSGCDDTGLEMPVIAYGRNLGASVTGGFIYRGSRLPGLVGKYLYADFVTGRIWALSRSLSGELRNEELLDTRLNISSFGEDANGELYLLAFDGRVWGLIDRGL